MEDTCHMMNREKHMVFHKILYMYIVCETLEKTEKINVTTAT